MSPDPAAWIPSRYAAADLRALVRHFDLTVDGLPLPTQMDGSHLLPAAEKQTEGLNVQRGSQAGTVTLPWIYLDFYNWLAIPPRTVSGAPDLLHCACCQGQADPVQTDKRLRLVIGATYTLENRWGNSPIECEVDDLAAIQFEFVDASLGTPSSEAGITAGVRGLYYFYLARFVNGAITERAPSAVFTGWPLDSAS